jgi:hypothetical protein
MTTDHARVLASIGETLRQINSLRDFVAGCEVGSKIAGEMLTVMETRLLDALDEIGGQAVTAGRIITLCAWAAIGAAWALPKPPAQAPLVMPPTPPVERVQPPEPAENPVLLPHGIKVTFDAADLSAYTALRFGELPPVEFDHPFPGPVILLYANGEIWGLCRIQKNLYPRGTGLTGCARLHDDGRCEIIIAGNEILKRWRLTPRIVVRHEIGHCNSWPADHPGAR